MLEGFVDAAIPLWEECILTLRSENFNITRSPRIDGKCRKDVKLTLPKEHQFSIPSYYLEYTTFTGRKCYNDEYKVGEEYEKFLKKYSVGWPEPRIRASCRRLDPKKKPVLRKLFPSGIQVIFKMANIYLSPKEPRFVGRDWGLEDTSNEHIVATAIYDYDAENITESRITFRENVWEDPAHEDDWHEHELHWYDHDTAFSEIGSVLTQPGRMLAFSGRLLDQIEPFELRDPTKPGHKKYLAMFLVDPTYPLLSTRVVPPQQEDWWVREVRTISPLSSLPREIFDMIMDFAGGVLMNQEKAEILRESLVKERLTSRKLFKEWQEDVWYEIFSDFEGDCRPDPEEPKYEQFNYWP
ncbi:hypothetical protein F5B19DRAFT_456821 [Rostrohypoxylon terebratum]|nr:hypothetical protein F5B19DRAFT_456821 [Rostrohypoxylon terebratum]